MPYYLHQMNGKWHFDKTRITIAMHDKSPQLKMVCWMTYVGLEGLSLSTITSCNSVLSGKEALENVGLG